MVWIVAILAIIFLMSGAALAYVVGAAAVLTFIASDNIRFLARGLHRISDGLEVPMAFITVAVPLTVVIIFIHLFARLIGSDADQPAGDT